MKTTVTLQTPVNAVDTEGIIQQTWQDAVKISVTELPITQELAMKFFGYSETVEKRMFYKGSNSTIKNGNRVLTGGVPLYIVSVLGYGKVTDFLVDKNIPGGAING